MNQTENSDKTKANLKNKVKLYLLRWTSALNRNSLRSIFRRFVALLFGLHMCVWVVCCLGDTRSICYARVSLPAMYIRWFVSVLYCDWGRRRRRTRIRTYSLECHQYAAEYYLQWHYVNTSFQWKQCRELDSILCVHISYLIDIYTKKKSFNYLK